MSGRRQDWPRFARAEIRAFAEWLDREGWSYEGIDSDGHTIWSHPRAASRYKLPSTPKHFNVKLSRADVLRLLGRRPEGKRNAKKLKKDKAPRRDFALQQAQRLARERDRPPAMTQPVRCKCCGHVHDASRQKLAHFVDCRAWRCPGCGVLIDDRPERSGGTAIPVQRRSVAPPVLRRPKRLPWEGRDAPDTYDRGIDRLMREVPNR